MHPSPHTPGKGDDGLNKPDAGLFHDDVSLVKGSPNWALQRAFWEFKRTRGGHKFDPFVDAPEQATEAWTINGAATRGQNASYAETASHSNIALLYTLFLCRTLSFACCAGTGLVSS